MENEMRAFMAGLQLAEAQTYKNITVFPLTGPEDGQFPYLTLSEALAAQTLVVTEVSQAGSVPELKVVNRGDQAALLVDGEELAGAKQNRVLNTSILLKAQSETLIPVSCTEQGRWSYASPEFMDSKLVMAYKLRALKSSSVSRSLAARAGYHSDQGEVWQHISALHAKMGTASPTGAMKDAYEQRRRDLDASQKLFTVVPGQRGLLMVLDGEVAGFDYVSRPDAYAQLHGKLLKSYLIEALATRKPVETDANQAREKAGAFLLEAAECEQRQFPSVGHGEDLRFQKARMAGTALVHEARVIHSAFFRLTADEEMGSMASLRNRRRGVA
jgi:hypothetical protein